MNDNDKYKELSSTEQHRIDTREDSNLQSKLLPSQRSRSRVKLFIIVAGILFVSFLSVELLFHGSTKETGGLSTKRTIAIQLEVLNGTSEPKIALRVREILRSGGFDVVDVGNYKSSNVEKTMVIARTSDQSAAQSVASYLGIDKSRVLQQQDKNLYLDVSVVVGKDIIQLRPFK